MMISRDKQDERMPWCVRFAGREFTIFHILDDSRFGRWIIRREA